MTEHAPRHLTNIERVLLIIFIVFGAAILVLNSDRAFLQKELDDLNRRVSTLEKVNEDFAERRETDTNGVCGVCVAGCGTPIAVGTVIYMKDGSLLKWDGAQWQKIVPGGAR